MESQTPQVQSSKAETGGIKPGVQIFEEEKKTLSEEAEDDDIEDTTEQQDETSEIQDYYEDIDIPKGVTVADDDENIDFDYSQSHLEDFLKSQTANTLLKGSNVQSSQLINTFLTSYNKMKTGGATKSFKTMTNAMAGKDQMLAIEEKAESETERSQS